MVSAASPALLTGRLHWPASFRCQGGRGAPCLEGRGWGGILPVRPKRAKLHDGNDPFVQRPLNILVAEDNADDVFLTRQAFKKGATGRLQAVGDVVGGTGLLEG